MMPNLRSTDKGENGTEQDICEMGTVFNICYVKYCTHACTCKKLSARVVGWQFRRGKLVYSNHDNSS